MMLTKEKILGSDDIKKELVSVPEWGGDVYVRMMSGAERDNFEQKMGRKRKEHIDGFISNIRARLCVETIVNEKGEKLFTDADIAELGSKCAIALDRLFDKAQRLNGFTEEDIKELEKNLGSSQSEDSGSD